MMNTDGSGKTTLERGTQFSWSPDGTKLALTVVAGTGAGSSVGIHVIEVGKPGLTRLTTTRGDGQPSWSPDGKRIAYVSPVRVPPPPDAAETPAIDTREIWLMNADGSEQQRLVGVEQQASPSPNAPLRWSPDSSRLLFYSTREVCELIEEPAEVGDKPTCAKPSSISKTYVVDVATGALTGISSDTGLPPWPVWSPDGRRIAFTSNRDGNDEIYVMDPDGSNVKRLTHNDADDEWPSWSPDGKRLAFQSQPRWQLGDIRYERGRQQADQRLAQPGRGLGAGLVAGAKEVGRLGAAAHHPDGLHGHRQVGGRRARGAEAGLASRSPATRC